MALSTVATATLSMPHFIGFVMVGCPSLFVVLRWYSPASTDAANARTGSKIIQVYIVARINCLCQSIIYANDTSQGKKLMHYHILKIVSHISLVFFKRVFIYFKFS